VRIEIKKVRFFSDIWHECSRMTLDELKQFDVLRLAELEGHLTPDANAPDHFSDQVVWLMDENNDVIGAKHMRSSN
jgi:hypothetical protein